VVIPGPTLLKSIHFVRAFSNELNAHSSVFSIAHLRFPAKEADHKMKKLSMLSVGLCFLFVGCSLVSAQDPTMPPPRVLVTIREYLKPGRNRQHAREDGKRLR
jgi:hypothetical protein